MDPIIDYRAANPARTATSKFMSHVYGWMTFGLLITATISYVIGNDPALMQALMGKMMFFYYSPICSSHRHFSWN